MDSVPYFFAGIALGATQLFLKHFFGDTSFMPLQWACWVTGWALMFWGGWKLMRG
jgi:hypothetical protein